MRIDTPATNVAVTQQTPSRTEPRSAAADFMTTLSEVQGRPAASPFRAAEAAQPGEAPWVPWTEDELAQLAAQGMPESEIQSIREQTFAEAAADRWMRIIAPYLTEASLPDADAEALSRGRAKCPFLDWVLSGKDPVEFFEQPGNLSSPLHQVLDGAPDPRITAVAPPVTLTAARVEDTAPAGVRRAAGLPQSEYSGTLPAREAQPGSESTAVAAPEAGRRAEPGDGAGQGEPGDVAPGNGRPASPGSKPAVAAAERQIDSWVAPKSGTAESEVIPAAAVAAVVSREVVEEPQRVREPGGSKPPSAALAASSFTEPPAAGPRASAASSLPQNPEPFMSELAEQMQVQVRQGGNDIRIQLKPANLGHVEIIAQTGTEGVVARIVTESSAVKQYLETNLHALEQALVDQGLRMDRIDVVAQNYLDARQTSAQSDSQYGGAGQRAGSGSNDAGASAASVPEEEQRVESQLRRAVGPNSTFHAVA